MGAGVRCKCDDGDRSEGCCIAFVSKLYTISRRFEGNNLRERNYATD